MTNKEYIEYDEGLAANTQHTADVVTAAIREKTTLHANGLPGIFQSAKMGLGDLSLRILVDRTPSPQELEHIARHYNDFTQKCGYQYEVHPRGSKSFRLEKRLGTGDTILAYLVQCVNLGYSESVDISRQFGSDPNLLPLYLKRLENQE